MHKVARTNQLIDWVCAEPDRLKSDHFKTTQQSLTKIAHHAPSSHSRFILMAGAGAVALGVIFGAATLGAVACRLLAKVSDNLLIQPFVAVLIAGMATTSTPLWLDMICAGIAVAAFGAFFSLPWRLLAAPVIVGMLCHGNRWVVIDQGAGLVVGCLSGLLGGGHCHDAFVAPTEVAVCRTGVCLSGVDDAGYFCVSLRRRTYQRLLGWSRNHTTHAHRGFFRTARLPC